MTFNIITSLHGNLLSYSGDKCIISVLLPVQKDITVHIGDANTDCLLSQVGNKVRLKVSICRDADGVLEDSYNLIKFTELANVPLNEYLITLGECFREVNLDEQINEMLGR